MAFIVPPGGFAGFSQMTPASKRSLFSPARSSGGRRRKPVKGTDAYYASKGYKRSQRKKARRVAKTRRKQVRAARGMKFGSPAWQKKYKVGKYRK
jgi:hypothetical protein